MFGKPVVWKGDERTLEIKINKEIRRYQENLFFGLSLRQFVCSVLALGLAVGLYFLLKEPLGEETVSWVCILAAIPVAAMGFFQYHCLTLEQFLWAFLRSEFLLASPRKFAAENYHHLLLQELEKQKKSTNCFWKKHFSKTGRKENA